MISLLEIHLDDASDDTGRCDYSHIGLDPIALALIENNGTIPIRGITPDDLSGYHRRERLLLKMQQGCQSFCRGS